LKKPIAAKSSKIETKRMRARSDEGMDGWTDGWMVDGWTLKMEQ
jgi:hypothetical protein